jgi:hypothetical protein
MITPRPTVIVVGSAPEKMVVVRAVLKSHGFTATGVFSEQEAHQAIARPDELFAVVTGGSIDAPAQNRLRAAAASKGALLITTYIGHDDPAAHFPNTSSHNSSRPGIEHSRTTSSITDKEGF